MKRARSKKVTRKRRRSATKDAKAIAMTRVSELRCHRGTDDTLVVANTNGPLETSKTEKTVEFPSWEFTTHLSKVTFANRAIEMGGGLAFTLNLAPGVIVAANENSLGFADHISRRITRALKRLFRAVPFWFGIHVTPQCRPHVHGAIGANDNERAAVDAALRGAGGDWPAAARQFQLKLKRMDDPDGWARYVLRGLPQASRQVPGRVIVITKPLRSVAATLYAQSRARCLEEAAISLAVTAASVLPSLPRERKPL